MHPQPIRGYRFAGFTLDLARRRLSSPQQDVIALSGRAFEVLALLLANRDRMVTKRELMEAVWPRIVVEENNLTQAISIIRRALGDSRESPQFIATIAGRGYQFVGDARPVDDFAVMPGAVEAGVSTESHESHVVGVQPQSPVTEHIAAVPDIKRPISRRVLLAGSGVAVVCAVVGASWLMRPQNASRLPASIAVLPFKPLLAASRNEAIELGVAELLINRLSALPGVVVTPLSSVRRYAAPDQDPLQAGRDLEVAAVVDGYLDIQQDDVRVTARLLDVATGKSLWAGNFTDRLGDFFAMQDALVTQLVNALAVEVPVDARRRMVQHSTRDPEAWQLYANGRYQLGQRNPTGVVRARDFFEAAIAKDPQFALAITGLSEAWALSGTFALVPPRQAFEHARKAAQRALDIDPQLPAALVALGHVKTQLDHDWDEAQRLYQLALTIAPNDAWTHAFLALHAIQSRSAASAFDHISRAQALEPAAIAFMALGAWMRYHARQFDAARRQLIALLESAPGAVLARQFLGRVLLTQGDAHATIRLLEGRNDPAPGSYSNLGRAYALVGNEAGARAELERVTREGDRGFGVGYDLALLHLTLAEHEGALAALERAVDDGSQMIGYLNVDPALDAIRNEPRVREVARRIGLT